MKSLTLPKATTGRHSSNCFPFARTWSTLHDHRAHRVTLHCIRLHMAGRRLMLLNNSSIFPRGAPCRTFAAERAIDIAERQGHRHLLPALSPELRHRVPNGVLARIQTHFHMVIRGRIDGPLPTHQLRLPELEPLLELPAPKMWFPVPGMYGGFSFHLAADGVEAKLISESWSRIAGGSGQRHEITSAGSRLVEEGFV